MLRYFPCLSLIHISESRGLGDVYKRQMPFHWAPFLILMFVLIFPTIISYMLLPVGLKYLKTTVVAIYGYLILIVATIASLALGQDRFSWTQTFAIIFICIGVYLVEVAESKER